jgi:TraM recognition site of TraD and TraG
MKSILLGKDRRNQGPVRIPIDAFRTHFHLIGGTGKGKTTALHTMLQQLLMDPYEPACWFLFDRLGNFSSELLLWMASEYCTQDVRDRLVYVEPGREDVVLGFNPLLYDTEAHGYYRVERATEIVLRAWEDVNIEAMPRLARWVFNAFWGAAQLGLTISDCVHFLTPSSPLHSQLLSMLPQRLRFEWAELTESRSGEVIKILDSSRNRLRPYFDSSILRRMFGATQNRMDVGRFMREGKIVVFNLAPQNRLSPQLANTIGALVINEVLATARSLPRGVRYPTYLLLDEFQNFVGPDLESALPEVRQLGIRLILSHQGFSQLRRGDTDLRSTIFQCQSRVIFGVQGEDADDLAHELATIRFDPMKIKDELYSRKQRIAGHRIIELGSWSDSEARASQWKKDYGRDWSSNSSKSQTGFHGDETRTKGTGEGRKESHGEGGGVTNTTSRGKSQTVITEHEDFVELSNRTYSTFEEDCREWARDIRNLKTGHAFLRLVDSPELHHVAIKKSTPGFLNWDMEQIVREFPEALEDVDRLVEENFKSDVFVPPAVIDSEIRKRVEMIMNRETGRIGGPGPEPQKLSDPDLPFG